MLDFVIFAVTFVTALIIAVFYLYPGSRKTGTTIPGMDPSDPKDGNLYDIQEAGGIHPFLVRLHENHGSIASFWLETQLVVSLADPKLFKEHQHAFDRPTDLFSVLKPLLGEQSIFLSNGVNARMKHKCMTAILSEAVGQKFYPTYNKLIDEMLSTMQQHIPKEQQIPLNQYMMALAVKMILVVMFGDHFQNTVNIMQFRRNFDICTLDIDQKLQGIDLETNEPQQKKVDAAIAEIRTKIRQVLASPDGLFPNIASKLDGQDNQVDNAITLIYEGVQNTANLLTWLTYHVAVNENAQEKLAAELKKNVTGDTIADEQLKKLTYLGQIMDEALRLSNVRSFSARSCQDLDTSLGGHLVPKGTPIIHALGVVMLDPKLWAEPEKFDPERFSAEFKGSVPDLSFVPWGFAGNRMCPGKNLVSEFASLTLAELVRRFRVKVVEGQVVRPVSSGALTKPEEEIWITVAKRS